MAITTEILNPGFESGASGWTLGSPITIRTYSKAHTGSYVAGMSSSDSGVDNAEAELWNNNKAGVSPGTSVTASCSVKGSGADGNVGAVQLEWQSEAGTRISVSKGNQSSSSSPNKWETSTITATAPSGAAYVRIGAYLQVRENGDTYVDDFEWNYANNRTAALSSPADAAEYVSGAAVPLAVLITGSSPSIIRVDYKDGGTVVATTATPNYAYNITTLSLGTHVITADVVLSDGTTITTAPHTIEVVAYVPPPEFREFKASNSYTYLVGDNFVGLTSGMPPTAKVTAVEVELDYKVKVLARTKDVGIADPAGSNPNAVFDMTDGAQIELALLDKAGLSYTKTGGVITQAIPLDLADFVQEETGLSDGKKWTVFEGTLTHTTVGSDTDFFGLDPMTGVDFIKKAVGLRFYPVLTSIPSYAEVGDACVRFMIDKLRMRIYFDAGSVEYYFASQDRTEVIKGTLAAYNVAEGNLTTADASGTLQLTDSLEIIDGSQNYIGGDWTIHSSYPITDDNKIGDVVVRPLDDGVGMSYNGLPGYWEVEDNRSRYVFITANFYGDQSLDAMYGANGVDRAFSYNGDFFYKIWTQPDLNKDKPRHIAFHHTHLALGYKEGRVDLSVVGEPYNFSGVLGASSWATGDGVVGLLPLTGAMLGIFGSKSIVGLSGTTVDNFAPQTLSPNIGAIEYTVADMGFPVYANAYGLYTLEQTSSYGDYLGTPLSQPVSPWLRPRLVRKYTSSNEVVVAWPVRNKNQYRLAFADGYVLTMTLNYGTQQSPTFSKQKYFLLDGDTAFSVTYDYPAIVPAAISSQLADSGEERIHIADKLAGGESLVIHYDPPSIEGTAPNSDLGAPYSYTYTVEEGDSPVVSVVLSPADSLPEGLVWNENTYTISGIPYEAGDYSFTVTVTDARGLTAHVDNTVTIGTEWELLVAGEGISGGAPVSIGTLSFVPELSPLTGVSGADLIGAMPTSYNNEFVLISGGNARRSTAPTTSWTSFTVPNHAIGVPAGGPDGYFVPNAGPAQGDDNYIIPLDSDTPYNIKPTLNRTGAPVIGPIAMATPAHYYDGGYWAVSSTTYLGLCESPLDNAWALPSSASDPAGYHVVDACRIGAVVWGVVHLGTDGSASEIRSGLYADRDVPNGIAWATAHLAAQADPQKQPFRIWTNGEIVLVTCLTSKWVWTSADNFAEPHDTGLDGALASVPVAAAGALFCVIDGTNCVTTADGITYSEPVPHGVVNATGVAARHTT